MRTYNNLLKRAEQGEPVMPNLMESLIYERKQSGKMDLSEFMSPLNYSSHAEYASLKKEFHQACIDNQADATRNIPLLEEAIRKMGGDPALAKPRVDTVDDGPTGLGL